MNQTNQPPVTADRETAEKWREIIRIASTMQYGEIVIKVHQGKVEIAEYTIKKKPLEGNDIDILAIV